MTKKPRGLRVTGRHAEKGIVVLDAPGDGPFLMRSDDFKRLQPASEVGELSRAMRADYKSLGYAVEKYVPVDARTGKRVDGPANDALIVASLRTGKGVRPGPVCATWDFDHWRPAPGRPAARAACPTGARKLKVRLDFVPPKKAR